jgi:hypothetical protein
MSISVMNILNYIRGVQQDNNVVSQETDGVDDELRFRKQDATCLGDPKWRSHDRDVDGGSIRPI